MQRRRFLHAFIPTLVLTGAGCSSPREQRPALSIAAIEVENLSPEDITFDVAILTESETVFESSRRISAGDAVTIERPVDEPGDYSLEIAIPKQTVTQRLSLFATGTDSCVLPVGRLDQGGQLRIEGTGYSSCPS